LNLRKDEWLQLEHCLDASKELGFEEAKKIRAAIVLGPERLNYRERWYNKDATPSSAWQNSDFEKTDCFCLSGIRESHSIHRTSTFTLFEPCSHKR
jgi:hypothetical protein